MLFLTRAFNSEVCFALKKIVSCSSGEFLSLLVMFDCMNFAYIGAVEFIIVQLVHASF